MQANWHLRESDFFAGMPDERQRFTEAATRRHVAKGDFLFFEGDPGDSCFYLDAGAVKIFKITVMGKEPIFFLRKPGEIFGLAELVDAKERKANAQALADATVYEMGRAEFERLLASSYPLSRRVIEVLGRRLRYLGEQVESLMSCDVATRILKLLLSLAFDRTSASAFLEGPVCVPMRLTQEQIASMTGSCQQTVSELLKQLESDGLVSVTRKGFTIMDPVASLARIEGR